MTQNLLPHIAQIAAILCDASISFILLKNELGFKMFHMNGIREMPFSDDNIFLQNTLKHPDKYLIITDVKKDLTYANDNFLQFYRDINFFAGFLLIDEKEHILGFLCIMDHQIKQLDEYRIKQIKALAKEATEILCTKTENETLNERINALERTNSLYEQTNLVAKIGYWEVNYITNKLFWSNTTKSIHGVSHEYIPDTTSAINFFKDGWSRNRISECVEEASTNNKPFDEELQLITRSGEEIWVRAKGNAQFVGDECVRLYGTFQDINDYKQQQLLVEQSEIKYRSIIENSLTAFLLTKPDGYILDANKAAEEMFGYSVSELCKLGREGIIDMNDPNVAIFIKERNLKGKAQGELFGIRKSGEHFPLFVTSSIFKDANDELRTSLSILDTTERKKVEEDLRISKEEFSSTFEYASIGMALVGKKGEWIRVNKSLCAMLGYTSEELLKQTFQDITHPDDLNIDLNYLNRLVNDEIETYQMEKRYYTKSGKMLWVNLSVSKVTNVDGSVKHFISQIENINDRKKAEELLALSEQRFRAIFNSSYQLIAFLTPEGTILEINETALHFAGIQLEEVIEKNYWDGPWWQLSNNTQLQLKEAVANASKGKFVEYEAEILGANDAKLTILFNLKPIFDNSNNLIAILSEGRPIQEIADARKSLLFKNEELREFSAIASHDLKEPLRMIHIFMQMLEKNYAAQLDEKAIKYISTAIDGAKRMAILIEDLLTYSQIGSEEAEKENINTNEMVNEIVSFQKKILIDKEINIEVGDLPNIFAVATPIKMLFENLIGNALKYQKANNKPSIKISCTQKNNQYEFAISDNGIGISNIYNKKIFILFKRLHGRSEYSGTGMGLSICKKIVENHGGKIWVESVEDEGSTFYFTLNVI